MNFELPTPGREQAPSFLAANECRDWLQRMPLANPARAQGFILRELGLLHHFELPADARLAILEELRGSVYRMQEEAAKQFTARPLPLAPAEQQALDASLEVWSLLALGYLRCFALAADARSGETAARQALLAQRTMSVFADWQVDCCRGEQLPDRRYWLELHRIFATAEALGVLALPVDDPFRHGRQPSTALAAYAECNLLSTAALYELPARHLTWVARWARRWGGKIALLQAPPEDIRNRAQPLWADLESDRPAGYQPRPGGSGRWLETTALRHSLQSRIGLLDAGRAPADLQLGDGVTQPAAGQLLGRVLQRWCQGGTVRRESRRQASGTCMVAAGFDAAHARLTGRKLLRPPRRDTATLLREREEFETFGDRRCRVAASEEIDEAALERWEVIDDWQLLNASAGGMRLSRPLGGGARIGAGQLIGVSAGDGGFLLGVVRWALRNGPDLTAGVQLIAGQPRAASVRIVGSDGASGEWRQAFELPAVEALGIPPSLVLRAGSFRLDRRIEVMVGQQLQARRLHRILDHGGEFERCLTRALE